MLSSLLTNLRLASSFFKPLFLWLCPKSSMSVNIVAGKECGGENSKGAQRRCSCCNKGVAFTISSMMGPVPAFLASSLCVRGRETWELCNQILNWVLKFHCWISLLPLSINPSVECLLQKLYVAIWISKGNNPVINILFFFAQTGDSLLWPVSDYSILLSIQPFTIYTRVDHPTLTTAHVQDVPLPCKGATSHRLIPYPFFFLIKSLIPYFQKLPQEWTNLSWAFICAKWFTVCLIGHYCVCM